MDTSQDYNSSSSQPSLLLELVRCIKISRVPGVVARKPIGPGLNVANATVSSELYFCSSIVEIYKCNCCFPNTVSLAFFYFDINVM